MNLALTDPFILAQDYPEALTGKLSGFPVAMATSTSAEHTIRIWSCDLSQVQPQRGFPCFRQSTFQHHCTQVINIHDSAQVDGTIVIFDVETSEVARKLRGHTRQIQSIRYESGIVHC